MDVSSVDTRDEDAERESRLILEALVQAWREREDEGLDDIERGPLTRPEDEKADGTTNYDPSVTGGKRPGIFRQTVILVPRSVKNMVRAYPELIGHFLQAAIIGVFMGIIFYQLGGRPEDIQSLKTLAFQAFPVYAYMSQGKHTQ